MGLLFDEQADGAADFVQITPASDLDLIGGEFTLSAWINPSGWGQNNQGRILDHGGGSSLHAGWSFHLENKRSKGRPEGLRVQINGDSSFNRISDPNVITLNSWQHVAVRFDSGTLSFYVNGNEVGVRTGVPTPLPASTLVRIGARATDSFRGFVGVIDEVRIWNRALSQTEIQANMNAELSGSEPGLVAYYPLNEGVGGIAFDNSGNGHDGQLGLAAGSDVNDPAWVGY